MYAPTVTVMPKNQNELADTKAAELHQSVWADIKDRHKFPKLTRLWARDFVEVGECIAKVFFDDAKGSFLGYDPMVDETSGEAVVDPETGEIVYDQAPKFTGDLVFERILGFNLITDPDARSWEESRYCIYRKMIAVADLKLQFENDTTGVLGSIVESTHQTHKLFDSSSGMYKDGEGLVMVTEHYYRPCADYPEGYFYIAVEGAILFEGALPLGLYPIVYCGFDEASTSARSYSIIKQLRPYQAEINRCASKIAEHQITLGDDKVILSNGATMTPGGSAHGVKAINVTGSDPKVFAGRTGDQYAGYMQGQISEMYQVAMVQEDSASGESGQIDPYAILYKTAKQKKPFVLYIAKFEEFLVDICKLALRFAKAYYHDEMLVEIVGRREYINIPEFRNKDDLGYQIRLEAATEDIESKMGKTLSLNHFIQFAGQKLDPSDLGKVLRYMPWMNDEKIFEDLTQDFDNWVNDQLALDRGEPVPAEIDENHPYVIKKIRGRKKQQDFALLPDQMKMNYERKLQQHQQLLAKQLQEEQKANAGFIPSGGPLATIELYVPDPKDPSKQVRLRAPTESLMWLADHLASQGSTQEMLQSQDAQTRAEMGAMMMQQGNMPMAQPDQGMPMASGY
jgi:hypothetical protein